MRVRACQIMAGKASPGELDLSTRTNSSENRANWTYQQGQFS
jgi:hypothetical protein